MGLLDDLFGKDAIGQLKQQLAQKNDEVRQAGALIGDLQVTERKAREEVTSLTIALQEKEKILASVNAKLLDSESKKENLVKNLADLQRVSTEKLVTENRRATDLAREVAALKTDLSRARDSYAAIQQELDRQLDAYRQKDHKYQERELKLSEKSEKLLHERQRFQQQAADLYQREQHWKHDIEPKLKEYETHISLDLRQASLEDLERKLQSFEDSLQSREADMVRRKCDDESLRAREAEIAEWDRILSASQSELATSRDELKKQQAEQEARAQKLEEWARELFVLQSRVKQIDSDTEKLDRKKRELEAKEKERQALHATRLSDLREQRATLKRITNDINEKELALKVREKDIKREEAQIITIKNKNFALRNEVKELTSALESMEDENTESANALRKLEEKYQSLQKNHETALGKIRASGSGGKLSSSLINPKVLQWLLEEGDPNTAEIANGWLGSTGYGPWEEQSLDRVLDVLKYQFYAMPHADLDHIIVGRKGWSKSELLAQIEAREGSPLRIYSQEMFFAKLATGKDPFDTGDDELLEAFAEDHPALQFLMALPEPWPAVTSKEPDKIVEVDDEDFGVSESPLRILGYRVGATSKLSISERRKILSECFGSKDLIFSHDSDEAYIAKWGRGGGAQRLYRMAVHIKSLADGRVGKDYRKPQARIDWINDLKWLKEKYFNNYKSRFSWPGV